MLLDTPTPYINAYCNRTVADCSLHAELQCIMFRACHPEISEAIVRGMSLCVSRLVRLICCRIILTASSSGRQLICRSLVISLTSRVAAQAVRWSGIPKVARSRLTQCSKSCDLQPSPHCSVQYVELRGYCPV